MGEIYRSATVIGTRKLETERIGRVRQESRERRLAGEAGFPPAGTTEQEQAPAASASTGAGSAPAPAAAFAEVDHPAMEQDLLLAQQRRLDQLEESNAGLREELAVALEALEEARGSLNQQEANHRDQGYKAGYQEAEEAISEQRVKLEAEFEQARTLFSDALQSQQDKVKKYAVELAFAALARIIGEHHAELGFSRAVVEEALTAVQGAGRVAVHISQQDFDLLRGIEANLADASRVTEVELIPDPRVSVGGCLIETETGIWDARLETQLQRLKDSIEQAMRPSA